MRLIQFSIREADRRVGLVEGNSVRDLTSVNPAWQRVIDVAVSALSNRTTLEEAILDAIDLRSCETYSWPSLISASGEKGHVRLCPPVDHQDEHRVLISGTGLTHTGGMKSRDQMHSNEEQSDVPQTDSARMFQMGIEGGKPSGGNRGAAPEWFYKGNGFNLKASGQPLEIPSFADDGGEEPEIAAVYIIDDSGTPRRLGFCLGNEWSDHKTEKVNYLYLAPSKLRTCAIGPELVTDLDFTSIDLRCTVTRGEETIYDSGSLLSGGRNMCHSLANCEDHHFKYPQHRRPGDVHIHFFGTSKLSFSTRDWTYQDGDTVRIESPQMGAALENPIRRDAPSQSPIIVEPL